MSQCCRQLELRKINTSVSLLTLSKARDITAGSETCRLQKEGGGKVPNVSIGNNRPEARAALLCRTIEEEAEVNADLNY